MKPTFLIFILLTTLSCFSQTKKETIDWLNSKFQKTPLVTTFLNQFATVLKIHDDGSFEILDYEWHKKEPSPNKENYVIKRLTTGNFKDLSPNSVRTSNIDGNIYFYAGCTKGRCIKVTGLGKENFNTNYDDDMLIGIIYEPSLEERCKNALIHLIETCGGKKEPF